MSNTLFRRAISEGREGWRGGAGGCASVEADIPSMNDRRAAVVAGDADAGDRDGSGCGRGQEEHHGKRSLNSAGRQGIFPQNRFAGLHALIWLL